MLFDLWLEFFAFWYGKTLVETENGNGKGEIQPHFNILAGEDLLLRYSSITISFSKIGIA